jgi:hypothetical protein
MRVVPLLVAVPSWAITCYCLLGLAHGYTPSNPPFLTRLDMCGIWKLTDIITTTNNPRDDSSVMVLRLKEDGTFDLGPGDNTNKEPNRHDDATTTNHLFLSRGGCWQYQEDCLLLAVDRPQGSDKGPDTVLKGTIQIQVTDAAVASEAAISTSTDEPPSEE